MVKVPDCQAGDPGIQSPVNSLNVLLKTFDTFVYSLLQHFIFENYERQRYQKFLN